MRVLVTGVGGPAGSSVSRLLLERGHEVIGADIRSVDLPGVSVRLVPPAGDPLFLEALDLLARQQGIDLVIPTVTEELIILADGWRARNPVPIMVGPAESVRIANDKYSTCRALAEAGVAVPRFALPSEMHSPEDVARRLGWPCLSKPRQGRGGRGVVVHAAENWPNVAALDDRQILQEFLSGTDYCPNVWRGRGAKPVVVVLEKTELREGIVGNAVQVKRVHAPDVAALALAAAGALAFEGPLDIDVRRGSNGKPAVLEINARFGANIAHATPVLDAALASVGIA